LCTIEQICNQCTGFVACDNIALTQNVTRSMLGVELWQFNLVRKLNNKQYLMK